MVPETLTWGWPLVAALLLGVVALAVLAALGWRRWLLKRGDLVGQQMLQEIDALREQLQSLQHDVKQLKRSQHAATPYGQAILMAQQGLDAREVAAVCGLSRGEAELIVALYKTHYS